MAAPAATSPVSHLDAWVEGVPGYQQQKSVAGMTDLFVATARAAVTPPYPWLRDCLVEASQGIRRSLGPLVIAIFFFAFGAVFTTIGGVVEPLGTPDRYGAGLVSGWPRETGYWLSSMVFAGVVGSAITADLGARKIRDELDAIRVLGIDPVNSLVVPRVVALTVIAPILVCFALIVGMLMGYATAPLLGTPSEVFMEAARAFITSEDLISALLKATVTGVFVGVVACYKGLHAGGGAEGVGRAVKETVVITFFGLWLLNTLWNEFFLAVWRDVPILRG